MNKKLPIVSELLKAGFRKGSLEFIREYKRRYQAARREDPSLREKEREKWRKWRGSKPAKYHTARVRRWREANPEKWRKIAKRASTNGLHRRWYKKNREKKLASIKAKRIKENPLYGIGWEIVRARKGDGDIGAVIARLEHALARLGEKSNKR